jgi:preprotein translocase subunit SecF
MELIPSGTNIDFIGKRLFFILFSLAINLLSIVLMLTWGLNYGLDFAGGAMIEVRFSQPTTSGAITQAVKDQGLEDLIIQDIGRDSKIFLLRFKQSSANLSDVSNALQAALAASFGQTFEVLRAESVGSKVSGDLRRKGFLAAIFVTLLMGVYIALRFDLRFGLGAVIALIHDVLVVTGALTLTQMSFDLTVLAAILTLVGYSVNDKIVIFDRVRENLRKFRRESLAAIINRSINESLSRTIITGGATLLVLLVLFTLGGYIIRPFAFALIVGIITGTYSSIYVGAPVVLYFESRSSRLGRTTENRTTEKKAARRKVTGR